MKIMDDPSEEPLTDRQKEVLEVFQRFNRENAHKMKDVPIFVRNRGSAED